MGKFEKIGQERGKLLDSKQKQYGSEAIPAVEKMMGILFPQCIPSEKIGESILISRILEKLCRITFGDGSGDEDAFADIQGYAMIGCDENQKVLDIEEIFTEATERDLKHPMWGLEKGGVAE